MESYKLLLFLHILAVTVGLGVTFAFPFMQAVAERSGTTATRIALTATRKIENLVIIPGNVLLMVFGVGLIFDDGTGYKDDFPTWLMIAIPWYLAAFLAGMFIQRPLVTKALATLQGRKDERLPGAYLPLGKRMQMVGGILGLSIVGVLFLMTWKPGG